MVVEAIGNKKGFAEEAKVNFANSIIGELNYVIMNAKDNQRLLYHVQPNTEESNKTTTPAKAVAGREGEIKVKEGKLLEKLNKNVSQIQCELAEFRSTVRESRIHIKSYMDILNTTVCNGCNIDDVIRYFEEYKKRLNKLESKLPEATQGGSNIVSYNMTKFVAEQYRHFFNERPSTSKSRKHDSKGEVVRTPFDRICDVLEGLFKEVVDDFTISDHIRVRAIGSL